MDQAEVEFLKEELGLLRRQIAELEATFTSPTELVDWTDVHISALYVAINNVCARIDRRATERTSP